MKCLPASKIRQAKGTVLHDWHAEIVAIRAFNRFILEECKLLGASGAQESRYVRRTGVTEAPGSDSRYFSWKQHVKLYMYCSEAPCMLFPPSLIFETR
jgi:tRNA-specific adenosine deaminase 1